MRCYTTFKATTRKQRNRGGITFPWRRISRRSSMNHSVASAGLPAPQGLYHPQFEHDACGIGFVANIKGQRSHDIILKGIQVLINLAHRGACGCDPQTGDGAGVLIQIPHKFFARECSKLGFVERTSGTSLTNNAPDTYYLSRLRIHLGIKPVSWLRFYAEAQDARVAFYTLPVAPSTIYSPLDLRQAYVELTTHGPLDFDFRAGRQELLFGGQRLIG